MSSPVALLVEDEPQIRRFLRTALEAEGWTVHETDTQRQGLIDAGTRKPDLIIVDLGLPDGDGVTLIREVRAWSAVPVIVLSARAAENDKIAALDAGADDYLTKPFGVRELLARVRATLRRHRLPPGEATARCSASATWRSIRRRARSSAVARRSISRRWNIDCCRCSSPTRERSSRTATSCARFGDRPASSIITMCACRWGTCGASSRTIRRSPATCSPRPRSATGWPCS